MKNYAKALILLAFVSYEISIYNTADNVMAGYLHNKILEETVPSLKEFNLKLRALFLIKNNDERAEGIRDLLVFVDKTIDKLNNQMRTRKLTPAEIKSIKTVISFMRRKVKNLK